MMMQPARSNECGSKVKWRNPQAIGNVKRLARDLRLDGCDADEMDDLAYYMRVAVECAEHSLKTAIGLQVREMTFERLPECGEPLELDCADAWTMKEWQQFTNKIFDSEMNLLPHVKKHAAWKATIWNQINDCFQTDAPAEICIGDKVLSIGDFKVSNSRRPNRLCLKKRQSSCGCQWPRICDSCDCDLITVRYLCGDLSDCPLDVSHPKLHQYLVINAGIMWNSPQTGGAGGNGDIQSYIDRFGNSLKWRL